MVAIEAQLERALTYIYSELNLSSTEIELTILELQKQSDGAVVVSVGISRDVYAWVRVAENGQAAQLNSAPR